MFHKVLCTPLLKLQVLFIKLILMALQYLMSFLHAQMKLGPLSDVTLSKNPELLCGCMFATNSKQSFIHVSKEDVKWLSYLGVEYYLGK